MTQQKRSTPVWRSLLYVPANVEKYISKAHSRGADGVILDLEDSVPLSEKEAARKSIQDSALSVGRDSTDVLVRINRPLRLAIKDIEACVSQNVRALFLPKIEGPDHVRLLDQLTTEIESERGLPNGSIGFVVMIESASAFWQMEQIARSSPRIDAVTIGAEDLATDLGMIPDPETLQYPKQQSVFAARAAGVVPLGLFGTVADYQDLSSIRVNAEKSRKFGFEGASCIHPNVIPILNEAFGVSTKEAELAQQIIDANQLAIMEGRASFELHGRMVDVPVVDRARALLERYRTISNRN